MEPHFFQLLDRIRYEASVAALSRNGKSLAIISPVQALAEHYKEMLLERLAVDVPHARIKPFFPADTDAIVSSFNQVVADLPLTQAMAAPTSDRPLQVWVVHDAAALPAGEVLMMLDLLDKFPGAHVRALLVFAGTEIAPEGLENFDKSLMRWVIDRPSLEQIKDSLSRVDDPMQAAEVRDLIARMAPGHAGKSVRAAAGLSVPGSAAQADEFSKAGPSKSSKAQVPQKSGGPSDRQPEIKPQSSKLKIAAVVAGLLLFSAGVAAWLNPQAWQSLIGQTAAVATPAQATPEPPAPAPEPVADPAKAEEPPASAAGTEAPADGKEPATAEAAPAPEKVYALMTAQERQQAKLDERPDPKAKPTQATQAAPANDKAKKTNSKSVDPEVELPAGVLEGQAWVKGFARGTFVVQHTNSETYAKARDRQKRFPNLSEAKVVPQFEANQSQAKFALISGPFESKELADTFLKSENMPKESWVRSSRAIQKRLTPTLSDTSTSTSP